jgi:CMP-N-acetylneuraminic acid synthetase
MANPKNYRILAVTLARGGSKGIHKKNIRLINGVPLIAYTIVEALRSKYVSRYIISTDDEEIRSISLKYGAEAPFLRPAELSSDEATSASAVQHAVDWCEKEEKTKYDYVIELMCTNPMKTSHDIDAVLQKLIETDADSVIGVTKLEDHHPARAKKIVDDRIVDFCVPELSSRRQDLKPDAYIRNGAIYAMKRDVLMIQNARYGTANSCPYIMAAERSVNIDSALDCLVVEFLLKQESRNYLLPL